MYIYTEWYYIVLYFTTMYSVLGYHQCEILRLIFTWFQKVDEVDRLRRELAQNEAEVEELKREVEKLRNLVRESKRESQEGEQQDRVSLEPWRGAL